MISAQRTALAMALTLSLLTLLPAAIRAQTTVEVYPGPGVDTYKSNLYTVEVFNGAAWVPSYVYQYSRKSFTHWHPLDSPSVGFTTFGTTGPVNVRVSKLGGSITTVDVYPRSKNIRGKLTGGQAIGTLNQNDKLWLIINGDDANPLFVFADAPKPCVPPGATYFGPGIREIAPATANHYKASSNEVIYLDGGAWVRGNIDVSGTRNVQVMGPGVLSGDLWMAETIANLPYDQFTKYAMITGDFYGGNGTAVRGITIVDTPAHGFFGGANNVYSVKILSPWFYGTDAFPGVSHVDHSFCFNGDEVFTPQWAGLQGENVTITSSFAATANNAVFAGGYWGFESIPGYTALADDIDVVTYNNDDWGPPLTAGVFQVWVDNSDSTKGYRNQTYQNIRIDNVVLSVPVLSLKNVMYPWGGPYAVNPPLGNSSNFVFKNISVTGTPKYRSEIKGWDASNGFHNVILDNFSFNGEVVNQSNLTKYFDINSFVSGLGFTAPTPPCVADATTLCLSDGRFRVRAAYDTDTSAGDGKGVALTSDTGYFWFFSPSNVEMVVKVLNGCGLNQNYWVFAGGLTNVGVTLTVTDTKTGVSRSYRNVRGTAFLPLQRTGDFSVCNAGSVITNGVASESVPAGPDASVGSARLGAKESFSTRGAESGKPALITTRGERWAAGDAALCLNNGRFQVRASYDSDTSAGDGHGVALSSDTGYFWFFSPSNVEIIVKVLNACSINQNFWVFAGGLTNVGVTLTVTDTQTGATRTYRNVRGTAYLPLQRTTDFGVCP